MRGAELLLLCGLVLLIGASLFWTVRRARQGSACCGPKAAPVKRTGCMDRDRRSYPYEIRFRITGMTCDNCAARVENALNALDGVWARVRISDQTARIRCREKPDEAMLKRAVHEQGYGISEI